MTLPIYLDYAATTPVDPAVAREMMRWLTAPDAFGNPSSTHPFGRAAAAIVEHAREQLAALIGARPAEIVFTSGATESNNLAVLGVARANADRGRHLVASRIEHKSVLDACKRLEKEGFRITWLAPDGSGRIDPGAVRAALRPDTVLVSVMHVSNEIGVIQDIAAIGGVCREAGVAFHTDAAQSVGRIALDVSSLPLDFVSLTSHKIYGPKGIGALYVRRGARALLAPQSFGGGQEQGLRSGTPATHQIAGFGAAAELAARLQVAESERITRLRDRLWSGLERLPGILLNGGAAPRVPHILNVSVEGVDGESLVTALDFLALSTGSACGSATGDPSYVLRALGRGTRLAESSLRLSFGRFTTEAEVEEAARRIREEVCRLRRVAPCSPGVSLGESTHAGARLDSAARGLMDGERPAYPGAERTVPPPGTGDLTAEAYRLFRELPHAGPIPDDAGRVLRGEAGGPADEAWVRFHVAIDGDSVKDARFEALGCPHTLAAAAWIASRMRGRRRSQGVPEGPQTWARVLGVPVEKLGRLLIVEDALARCLGLSPPEPDAGPADGAAPVD